MPEVNCLADLMALSSSEFKITEEDLKFVEAIENTHQEVGFGFPVEIQMFPAEQLLMLGTYFLIKGFLKGSMVEELGIDDSMSEEEIQDLYEQGKRLKKFLDQEQEREP